MHIRSLKLFCDIATRQSFSKGAELNGVTQSSASQTVGQLEESFGVRLIDRSRRPFALTAEGEVFLRGAREIVDRFSVLQEELRSLHAEVSGQVSVASIYSIGLSHLSRAIGEFLSANPGADLRVEYQHPDRVLRMVEDDVVDVGLTSYPQSSRGVRAIRWLEEPMVLAFPPGHSFEGREEVPVRELEGVPMVAFLKGLPIRAAIDSGLAGAGVRPSIVMEFDNLDTIKRAVEIGAGIGILPEPSIEREVSLGTLATARLTGVELTRPLGILFRRGRIITPTARRLVETLFAGQSVEERPRLEELEEGTAAEHAPEDPMIGREGPPGNPDP